MWSVFSVNESLFPHIYSSYNCVILNYYDHVNHGKYAIYTHTYMSGGRNKNFFTAPHVRWSKKAGTVCYVWAPGVRVSWWSKGINKNNWPCAFPATLKCWYMGDPQSTQWHNALQLSHFLVWHHEPIGSELALWVLVISSCSLCPRQPPDSQAGNSRTSKGLRRMCWQEPAWCNTCIELEILMP